MSKFKILVANFIEKHNLIPKNLDEETREKRLRALLRKFKCDSTSVIAKEHFAYESDLLKRLNEIFVAAEETKRKRQETISKNREKMNLARQDKLENPTSTGVKKPTPRSQPSPSGQPKKWVKGTKPELPEE